jgi:hypothetical protein
MISNWRQAFCGADEVWVIDRAHACSVPRAQGYCCILSGIPAPALITTDIAYTQKKSTSLLCTCQPIPTVNTKR